MIPLQDCAIPGPGFHAVEYAEDVGESPGELIFGRAPRNTLGHKSRVDLAGDDFSGTHFQNIEVMNYFFRWVLKIKKFT